MGNKYIAIWDAGWGQAAEVIEADSQDEASDVAYELAREEWESNASYCAKPWTQELEDSYT